MGGLRKGKPNVFVRVSPPLEAHLYKLVLAPLRGALEFRHFARRRREKECSPGWSRGITTRGSTSRLRRSAPRQGCEEGQRDVPVN